MIKVKIHIFPRVKVVTQDKLQEVTYSKIYHDNNFLEFLKSLRVKVNDHHHDYQKLIGRFVELNTVLLKEVNQQNPLNRIIIKKIVLQSDKNLYHLGIKTLLDLFASELDYMIVKIEKQMVKTGFYTMR